MEEMVPELEDLEKRGYFAREEIKQIAQRRMDFEYALKRRAALVSDFLRYVEYETQLEQLRQLRRQDRNISGQRTLADYCIVRRTHFIFERMLRKFRGNTGLWSRWIAFCQRTGSGRQMSKVLTSALKYHPTAPAFWVCAAVWEFERHSNTSAARALMQRGLRMCPGSAALWHEYFRMELLYAARLAARRDVLGTGSGSVAGETGEEDQKDEAMRLVLAGGVAKVVFGSSLDGGADSLGFRAKFLDILQEVGLPGTESLRVRAIIVP
jgi:U3 small nucleolar RNA-associated protein 6